MRRYKKIDLAKITTLAALSATAAFAVTTPYDLIRPAWPVSWDSTTFDQFDTTESELINPLNFPKTPASFKAGEIIPDTLDQAYYDAINSKISPIRVNQVGYLKSDKERLFYFIGNKAEEFEVVDAYGKSLSKKTTGTFTASENETQSSWTIIASSDFRTGASLRYKIDFTGPSGKIFIGNIPQSVPTETRLRIKVGDEISSTFIVSDDVYTMAKDASLKFFGIQRSGNSESWFHGPSHLKDGSGTLVNLVTGNPVTDTISPKAGDLQGGWYDCGDHLKESQTQAFSFMALAVMSATNPSKDVDHYAYNQGEFVKTDGIPDVLREAKHGADFFLRAYRVANGVIDNMPVSVGNTNYDHGYWGRPEAQDNVVAPRRGGAAERDVRLGELGSNVSAEIAAGLAILGKNYAKYDSTFADSCLMVAKKMYEFAKNLKLKSRDRGPGTYDGGKPYVHNIKADGWSTPTHNGNNYSHDDLSVAAIALHYATYEKTKKMDYLNDAVNDTSIYTTAVAMNYTSGWMSWEKDGMRKIALNTDWGSTHTYALYAFYKLLLKDSTTSSKYGISASERLEHIEKVIDFLAFNISELSYPIGNIDFRLPPDNRIFTTEPTWFTMLSLTQGYFNYAQTGNTFDVLAYADVAKDIVKQGETLPNITTASLLSEEIFQIGINKLNYLFGMNPWDVSLVYGVGDKNDAHPHHRAANPEGSPSPGLEYKYRCPTGAVLGGVRQGEENKWAPTIMSWEDYSISETCLFGSALLMSALTIASNGGSDYYEKKCDNCNDGKAPITGSVYPLVYLYHWYDVDAYNIRIDNATLEDLDSVKVYVYFEATKEDFDSCNIIFDLDICEKLNIAGFHELCDARDELRNFIKNNPPYIIEDTFDKDKKTYTWAQEIPIESLDYGTQIRLDIAATSGTRIDGKCETLRNPPKAQIYGWSFAPHDETKDAPAYDGAPIWDKNQGDIQNAPKDPYVVIRNKEGDLLWGYGPGKTTDDRTHIARVAEVSHKARMQLNGKRLFVMTTAQGTKTLKLFDLLGNQLMESTFEGTRAEIALERLPRRGTIIAKLTSNGKPLAVQTFKVK